MIWEKRDPGRGKNKHKALDGNKQRVLGQTDEALWPQHGGQAGWDPVGCGCRPPSKESGLLPNSVESHWRVLTENNII